MESIGKYQITGELGSGGFGRVYKAFDPTVGRVVAIKVLNVQDDPALIMRFEAEAKTSANLQHKNIVIVHEFGEQIIDQRTKKQFLVMEYLSGKNLQEIINERTPIAPLDKLLIMAEVAQGLQFAHEHSVVHRDVKPANIMRLSDGSVKIMDFGIARLMRGVNTRLTQAGIMIGTPQYMAPEQFTSDTSDERCDIWAYGVVFYEFLAGINPFHGDNAPQMIFRVTAEDPPPISTHLPGLPRSLDAILRRLLSKSRDDRYSSLEDVRFDLEPVLVELRRAQVEDDLNRAAALIADEHLDEALTVVRRILESDQTNVQARKWRRELPERIKIQSLQVRIKALTEQAEADVARRDYSAALEKLAEAIRLDRSNEKVRARMDEVLAEQERVARGARLLSEARAEYEQYSYTAAFEHAKDAAKTDPDNPDAAGLIATIGQAIERQDAEAQRKAGLNKAKGLILVQAYENAVSVLQDLAARYPDDPETREKLAEARSLQAAYLAQQKVEATILESRELIRKGQFQRAIDSLEALDKNIPQKKQVSELIGYAREQLEAEKRAAEVEDLIRRASEAPAADFESSLRLVDRALDLAPGDEKALRLRKTLLAARQADQENRAIQRSVQDCRGMLLAGRLDEAIPISADLKARRPDHPSVIALVKDIDRLVAERGDRKNREMEARRREVELLIDQGKAGEAIKILGTLTIQYPGERSFKDLVPKAKDAEQEQKRREAVHATLMRAGDLSAGKRWDQALAELEKGLAAWPNTPELVQEKDRIVRLKTTQDAGEEIQKRLARHELEAAIAAADSLLAKFPGEARILELREQGRAQLEFERLKKEAESLVFQGDIERAIPVVEDLLRRAPNDGDTQRLKQTILRKQKRLQEFAAADQFCKRRRFEEAHDLVIRILLDDPEDAAAGDLLKRIERESFEYERQQKIEKVRAEASEHCKHRRYRAAVEILEKTLQDFPDDGNLQVDLRRAQEALAQFQRNEDCTRGRGELEALMKQRRFEDAIAKAAQLAASFPEESFEQDLRAAREAQELRDQQARLDAAVAEIEKAFRQRDAASVREMARKLLATDEDPRARALLEWSTKTESELKKIKRKTREPRFDWRLIAVAAGVLIALIAGWVYFKSLPVVREVRLSPREIAFAYQSGATLGAKTFQLTGKPADETWLVKASDPWFQASTPTPNGDIFVQVVDPGKLAPGEYAGFVTVSSKHDAGVQDTVRVRLSIVHGLLNPPPPPPLRISPSEPLTFSYQQGSSTLPADQYVELTGPPGETWVTLPSSPWFKATPRELTGNGRISIHVDPQQFGPGEYSGSVTVSAKRGRGATATVEVRLNVLPANVTPPPVPEVKLQPLTLTFQYKRGDPPPAAKAFQLTGKPSAETWEVASSDPWIKASPGELTGSGSISVAIDPQGLPAGDRSGTVTVSSKRSSGVRAPVAIRLTIQDAPPPPPPPPTEDPVNCQAADYSGLQSSTVRWTGVLMPGQTITINRHNAVTSGPPGKVTAGTALPGCDVNVVSATKGIDIIDSPSAANRYGSVTLKNNSSTSVPSVSFQWMVK